MKIKSLSGSNLILTTKTLKLVNDAGSVRTVRLSDLKRSLKTGIDSFVRCSVKSEPGNYFWNYRVGKGWFGSSEKVVVNIGCQDFDKKNWSLILKAVRKVRISPKIEETRENGQSL